MLNLNLFENFCACFFVAKLMFKDLNPTWHFIFQVIYIPLKLNVFCWNSLYFLFKKIRLLMDLRATLQNLERKTSFLRIFSLFFLY